MSCVLLIFTVLEPACLPHVPTHPLTCVTVAKIQVDWTQLIHFLIRQTKTVEVL